MRYHSAAGILGSTLISLASAQDNGTISCKSGVHVIVARASFEPAGFGILKAVADNITAQVPDSDSIAVPYPATFVDPTYVDSEQQGVGNMTNLVKQYGDACPDGRMAWLGYSQGSQVVLDTLIGTDAEEFSSTIMTDGVDEKYIKNVAAIILMGDPTRLANQSYGVGNATNNSVFPRDNGQKVFDLGLAEKMQSYCDFNDTYCDSGSSSLVHASYVQVYGEDAVKFVVDKVNAVGGGNESSNATASGTSGGVGPTTTSEAGASSTIVASNEAPAAQALSYWMTVVLGSALLLAICL